MKKKASWKVWPLIGRRKSPADRSGTSPVLSGDLPPVEVSEDDREIRIRAETPGMKDSELKASFVDGVLVIQGEKREDREEKDSERWFRESWYGSFERRIPLGPEADLDQVRATYRDGVLRISIPKREIPRRVVPLQEG